ncbi:MAG: PAS domain S-box protein [Limisphaerales bacterium]
MKVFARRIDASFGFAIIILILFGFAAWRTASRNLEIFHQVTRSEALGGLLERILVDMLNMETAGRGFVISGQETFLEPYVQGRASVNGALAGAQALATKEQQARLAILDQLIQQKLAFMETTINFRRAGDMTTATQRISSGQGKQMMDEIRKTIADMEADETALLQGRLNRMETEAKRTIEIVVVSGLVAIVLVALAGIQVRRDFQKRYKAETALRDASERLGLATRAGKVGIWDWNVVTGEVFWDDALFALYGTSREAMTPTVEKFFQILHPEDRQRVEEDVKLALRGEKEYAAEFRILWPDRSVHYLQANSTILRDQAGNAVRMLGTNWDVTQRKLEEQRFRDLLEAAPAGMIVTTREGVISLVNAEAETLFGYSRDELIGRPVEMLVPQKFRAIHPTFRQSFAASPRVRPMAANRNLVAIRKDGTEFQTEIELSPLQTESGLFVIAAVRDITERVRIETALREKEESLRLLAESMPQMVWMCRPDGWNIYFNQQWCDYTGLTMEQSHGHGWNIPFHPEDRSRAWDAWKRATESVGKYDLECRLRRADGVYRWFLIRGVPLQNERGEVLKWFGTCTDIDDMKQAEEKITLLNAKLEGYSADLERQVSERTAALRDSIKSLETLTYTMAHDLRAPLRGMAGYTEALLEDVPLNETGKQYAKQIHDSAERMSQLIKDLLDYGQLTHVVVPISAVDLEAEVEKMIRHFEIEIQQTKADVRVENRMPVVMANVRLLDQVLSNLISNALKFVAPGVAPRVCLRAEQRGTMVRFWIEDNGIGIAPEYQSKIFGVFHRLHTAEEYRGTGVGLAIVKRAVEIMKGGIGVESQVNKGSSFWIELPLAKEQRRKSQPAVKSITAGP